MKMKFVSKGEHPEAAFRNWIEALNFLVEFEKHTSFDKIELEIDTGIELPEMVIDTDSHLKLLDLYFDNDIVNGFDAKNNFSYLGRHGLCVSFSVNDETLCPCINFEFAGKDGTMKYQSEFDGINAMYGNISKYREIVNGLKRRIMKAGYNSVNAHYETMRKLNYNTRLIKEKAIAVFNNRCCRYLVQHTKEGEQVMIYFAADETERDRFFEASDEKDFWLQNFMYDNIYKLL
jgi:hypothetical protein